jgi:hypothetical protein
VQRSDGKQHVGWVGVPAQRDHGRVLKQDEQFPPAAGQYFVSDLLLQLQRGLVGNPAQPSPFGHGIRVGIAAGGHR